jgi:hypothetical protein
MRGVKPQFVFEAAGYDVRRLGKKVSCVRCQGKKMSETPYVVSYVV